ncbi:MAG TPA: CHAT domain-containing protein [Pyrinomonadaceae bacterium]|nr:CHAT domain-containing protein [Pyrinomonadaceae bacterium]
MTQKQPHTSRLFIALTLLFLTFETITAQTEETTLLSQGEIVTGSLAGGQRRVFRFPVVAGDFARVEVVPTGIDLVVSLREGDKPLIEIDGKNGFVWQMSVSGIASSSRQFYVELKTSAPTTPPGDYSVRLAERRPANAGDPKRIEAERHLSAGRTLFERGAEHYGAALKEYEKAAGLWRELNDPQYEGIALINAAWVHYMFSDYEKTLAAANRGVELVQQTKDKLGESKAINIIAGAYYYLGQHQKAADYYLQSLTLKRAINDRRGEGIVLARLADVNRILGDTEKTKTYLEEALLISREVRNRIDEAGALNSLAHIYDQLGQYGQAAAYYEEALAITRELDDRRHEAVVLGNLGNIYFNLARYDKARHYLDQCLLIARDLEDRSLEGNVLFNLGNVQLFGLKNYEKAREYYQLALKIKRELKEVGREAYVLNALGNVHAELNQYDEASRYYKEALSIRQETRDRTGQLVTLNSLAALSDSLGRLEEARNYYQQALTIARAVQDKSGEAHIAGNLMLLWEEQRAPRLAIFYGKQAINIYQEIRGNITSLDKESQRSFRSSVEATYRKLAELLIKVGRLPEAEQVLSMLKEEEYRGFVRSGDGVAESLNRRITLSPLEKETLARYEQTAEEITRIGQEYAALEKLNPPPGELKQRQDELNQKLEDARTVLRLFLESLKKEFTREDGRIEKVEKGLQAAVRDWNAETVVISTIVGRENLSIIVTTAYIQRPHIIPITAEDLDQRVGEFRKALVDPKSDPRPASQRLYDVLVKPLENDLSGVNAKTLIWSLDGLLRYAPVAALWDKKKGYLAQRYANAIITLASHYNLALRPIDKKNWQALGLGVSKEYEGFTPLSYVSEELHAIIRDSTALPKQAEQGVLQGRLLLNEDFTYEKLRTYLGRFPIVHTATHFRFIPGTTDESLQSFLLLGDGERLTLAKIRNSGTMFHGVELLTLSACDTAFGGKDADGRELEGFGALAQEKGARATVATLWRVDDESTRDLMVRFYELYRKPNLTKAEALRRAQLSLLEGKRFAHPYYWSPFVLIGNWW